MAEFELSASSPRLPQRKFLTILFADIVQSTSLIYRLDPEDALAALQPSIKIMSDAVHQYGGLVSSELGDGILAIFGAPEAIDDHAARACFAALQMQDSIRQFTERKIRVGIHSGEVVLRQVDHDLTSVYEASGPVVNIAQKIESSASPGGVLLSEASASLTGGLFDLREYSKLRIGASSEGGIALFSLAGARPYSRWHARAATGLSVFVGRTEELRILREAAAMARRGETHHVVIEGEPGAGKSRLARELIAALVADGWSSLEACGELTTQKTAWRAARLLVQPSIAHNDVQLEDVHQASDELSMPVSPEELSPLRALFGVKTSESAWLEEAPQTRRHMMREIFVKTLANRCAGNPTVILIDDAQWVDIESLDALEALCDANKIAPILIVFVYRAAHKRQFTFVVRNHIIINSLSSTETERFVEGLIGPVAGPGAEVDALNVSDLKANIVKRTGGVPLYIEELIRYFVDIGALVGSPGAYKASASQVRAGLPPTVQSVIAARIDRLSRDARVALEAASIVGDEILVSDLESLLKPEPCDLELAVSELSAASMIVGQPPTYSFTHDLVRDVCHSSMIRERRRTLFRRALESLASEERSASDRQLEKLHRFALGAEEWLRAAGYARLAAAGAIENSAYQSSLAFLDSALAAIERLAPTQDVIELEIDLRLETRIALGATTRLGQLLDQATKAEAKARAIGDGRRAALASVHRASALTFLGAAEESISASSAALQAALASKVPHLEVVARYILAQSNYVAGRLRTSANHVSQARQQLPQQLRDARIGTTGTTLVLLDVMEAVACAGIGEFQEAGVRLAEAAQLSEKTMRPYDRVALAYGMAAAAVQRGSTREAIAAAEPGLELVRKFDLRFFFPLIANQLGSALVAAQNASASLGPLRESLAISTELGHSAAKANGGAALGSALGALGRDDEAEETLKWTLDLARQQGFNIARITAASALADVLARQTSRSGEADQLFGEAVELSIQCEARPQLARTQLSLAQFRLRQGKYTEADSLTRQAKDAFRQMGLQETNP